MPSVTVDLSDLERIVFATSAIKGVEAALTQAKNDPFVRPHMQYAEAHDRLASAMRNAMRSEANDTLVKFDEPVTKGELKLLRQCPNDRVITIQATEKTAWDPLSAKGCIEMGTLVTGYIWPGKERPDLFPNPEGYAVRITPRGISKREELLGVST